MHLRPSLFIVLLSLVDVGSAAAQAPALPTEGQILRSVFGDVHDDPIACAWSTSACVPGPTHLSPVSSAALPAAAACASGTVPLRTCYEGSVNALKRALEAGDVLAFIDAGNRAKEVFRRALTEPAPPWLRGAGNLLAAYYASHALDLSTLGSCPSGSVASRYRCLAGPTGPSRETFQHAIHALDEHNGILVLAGRVAGAKERSLAIFESGSGPFAHAASASDRLDPNFRLGMPGLRGLAQYSFLRALQNMTAVTGEDERADLNTHRFHPSITLAGVAGLSGSQLLFAAARMGDRWDTTSRTWIARNEDMDLELKHSFVTLIDAATLADLRGMPQRAIALHQVFSDWSRMMVSMQFDRAFALSGAPLFASTVSDIGIFTFGAFVDPCGWINPASVVFTEAVYGWIIDPDSCGVIDGPGGPREICLMRWDIVGYAAWLGQIDTITVSLRDQYRQLIDSWGDPYPYNYRFGPTDTEMDLTYVAGEYDTATILRSGVRAELCKAELDAVGGSYAEATAAMSCDPESSDYNGWNEDCEGSLLGGGAVPIGGETFIPYPIAVRICPDYVADIVGLNDALGSSWLATCTTPYAYVDAVADFMSTETAEGYFDSSVVEAIESGEETMARTLVDFAVEAMLLTSPVAAVQQDRADLAYIADEYVVGGCNDTTFTHCHGLDVLEERLEDAKHALDKGLVLVERFGRVGSTFDWQTTGAESIPSVSQSAVSVCNSIGCLQGHRAHSRATYYRRLQEMLLMYHQVGRDRFEVAWRRFDIAGTACLTWIDADADTVLDTLVCDTDTAGCSESAECVLMTEAEALVRGASYDMLDHGARLDEQLAFLSDDDDLATFAEELSAYTDSIAVDLDAQMLAFQSGTDWLGFSSGRWYSTDDPDAITPTLESNANALAIDYRGFVDDYIERTTAEATFVGDAETLSVSTESAVASFCADEDGAPDPLGCGATDTWQTDGVATGYALITAINEGLLELCSLQMELPDFEGGGTTTYDVGTDYLDEDDPFYTGDGTCPQLLSPNLVRWDDHTGTLADRLHELENMLLDVQTMLTRIDNAVTQVELNARTWEPYLDALEYDVEKENARRHLRAAMVCIGASLGAAALWVSTLFDWGATAPAAWAATGGAVTACATAFGQDLAETTSTVSSDEELALLGAQVQAELGLNGDVAAVVDVSLTTMSTVFEYENAAFAFASEKAAMERAVLMGDATIENLYTDFGALWLNPVATHFEEQEAAALKASFRAYARDVRRLERAIQYEIGNALPEGTSYEFRGDTYYLPHLSELTTIASLSPFDLAYSELRDTGDMVALEQNGAMNLASAASVLVEIRSQFRSNYGMTCGGGAPIDCVAGDRFASDVWLVGETSELDDASTRGEFGNPGELALLGRSAFYAPGNHSYTVHLGPAFSFVRYGYVDLADYCETWSDGVDTDGVAGRDPVATGSWFHVYSLDETVRVSLAYLDHMIRGVGVETFSCRRTFVDGVVTALSIAPKFDALTVTYEQLLGDPDFVYDGDSGVENTWDERAANESLPNRFINAQTKTVQAILGTLVSEVAASDAVDISHLSLLPGNYLFWIDTADPAADVEDDLLTGMPFTILSSQAEQLRSIALICTDESLCTTSSSPAAQLLLLGDARQGDRCSLASGAQEQVAYRMDTALLTGTAWTMTTANTLPPLPDQVEEILSDNEVIGALGSRPLHTAGMILSVNGLRGPETTDDGYRWRLYRDNLPALGASPLSRLRIRIRQSYFDTNFTDEGTGTDVAGPIPCQSPDAVAIGI